MSRSLREIGIRGTEVCTGDEEGVIKIWPPLEGLRQTGKKAGKRTKQPFVPRSSLYAHKQNNLTGALTFARVRIHVEQARFLPAADLNGRSDHYVRVRVVEGTPAYSSIARTEAAMGAGRRASYDETLRIWLPRHIPLQNLEVLVEAYDYDFHSADDLLASAVVAESASLQPIATSRSAWEPPDFFCVLVSRKCRYSRKYRHISPSPFNRSVIRHFLEHL